MEDLTKTQIVLLALLVSFITSIATGIITTSLLAQAPQNFTQTIDRVVERVVPVSNNNEGVQEVVIVKEDDAVTNSIERNVKSVVRIKSPAGGDGSQNFYALGIIVSKQGHILSDKGANLIMGAAYTVVLSDGTTMPAVISKVSETGNFVLFKLQAEESRLRTLQPVVLSKTAPKLGQTVIAIQGREGNSVSVGRMLSVDVTLGLGGTDLASQGEVGGSPLLNLSGEVVGLKTSKEDFTLPQGGYTLVSPLSDFVASNS